MKLFIKKHNLGDNSFFIVIGRKSNSFLLILLLFFFVTCTKVNKQNEDYDKLIQTIYQFYESIEKGNINDRLSLFSPDAIILPNNSELFKFTEEQRQKWIASDKEWDFRLKDIEHIEIEMSGDIAYSINSYYYTYHKKGAEPEWHKTKNVHIWKKQKDKTWKLHADIWNSSANDF